MARSAFGPITLAVFWVPIGIMLVSHLPLVFGFPTGDPFIFTLLGTGAVIGALSLSRLAYSIATVALAIVAYTVAMPVLMAVLIFIVGLFTGLVKIGHI
jgi:hypothetical protein